MTISEKVGAQCLQKVWAVIKKNYLSDFLTWESRKRSIPTPHFASLGHVMTRHFNIVLLCHKGHSFTVPTMRHFTKNLSKFSDLLFFYEEVTHCPSDISQMMHGRGLKRNGSCGEGTMWQSDAFAKSRV